MVSLALALGFVLILVGLYGALTNRDMLRMIVGFTIADTGVNTVLVTVVVLTRIFLAVSLQRIAMLMPELDGFERRTVTYCQLGEERMKPTDLWGAFPPGLELPAMCRNGSRLLTVRARRYFAGQGWSWSGHTARCPAHRGRRRPR